MRTIAQGLHNSKVFPDLQVALIDLLLFIYLVLSAIVCCGCARLMRKSGEAKRLIAYSQKLRRALAVSGNHLSSL